jgi:hypothetical protein
MASKVYRATAKVFVLNAGQVDSDRLAAFTDNMDAPLRHAIETETTGRAWLPTESRSEIREPLT